MSDLINFMACWGMLSIGLGVLFLIVTFFDELFGLLLGLFTLASIGVFVWKVWSWFHGHA